MDELHSKYAAAHNRSSIWSSVYYQTIMYTRELVFESEYIFVGLQSLDDIATFFSYICNLVMFDPKVFKGKLCIDMWFLLFSVHI